QRTRALPDSRQINEAIQVCDAAILVSGSDHVRELVDEALQFAPKLDQIECRQTEACVIEPSITHGVVGYKAGLSLSLFASNHLALNSPCTIHNALNHWPALSDRPWSLESLRAVIGHRWIPVEIGSKYTDDNWSQK
ncbi:Lysine-specific demethylase 8, partial [Rhizoclosmatium hyalinum]